MRRIAIAIPGLILCAAAFAQDEGQLQSDFRREGDELHKNCSQFKTIFSCLQTLVTGKPLHITGGSIAPQNGMGVGAAFAYEKNVGESWRTNTNADAVGSTNGSWRAGFYFKAIRTPSAPPVPVTVTQRPAPGAPLPSIQLQRAPEFNLYTQVISLNKLDYYGLGQFTPRPSLAFFGMRQAIVGGNGIVPLGNSGAAMFFELNGRWVEIRGRLGDTSPSIEQVYTNATAPGLANQPGFFQPGEGLKFARSFSDRLHLNYSATIQEYIALSDSQYSFQRLNLDFSHDIPLYRKQRSASANEATGPDASPKSLEQPRFTHNREGNINLRALVMESFTGTGHVVPFYFQPTLGGADINCDKMLASYPDYRFRGPNLMLFRASIEHSIWGPLGAMLMADTGKVGIARGDLGFDHLRHSYGVGLTIRAGGYPMVQLLFAFGGHEGTHTIAAINPAILGGGARPSLY